MAGVVCALPQNAVGTEKRMKKHTRLAIGDGEVHILEVSAIGTDQPSPLVVVFSHGFTVPGFESRRMFLDAAQRLAGRGIPSLLFDYRGSGYSDGRFEDMTLTTELTDLEAVVGFAASNVSPRVAIWAMSLGTAVAARFAQLSQRKLEGVALWGGAFELPTNWTKQYRDDLDAHGGEIFLPSGFKFTRPLFESVGSFDIGENLRETDCPLLFVHGTDDEACDIAGALRTMAGLERPFDQLILEGGNHGFHHQPAVYEQAMRHTVDWMAGLSGRPTW
jgi:pimeloyl-ACP methyl ester carboxylesterase